LKSWKRSWAGRGGNKPLIKFHEHQKEKSKKQKTWQEFKKLAKQKWLEIMDEDKKIKKWYLDFVKEALTSKTEELNALKYYRKSVLSKNSF